MWGKYAVQSYMKWESDSRQLWGRHSSVATLSVLATLISNDEAAFCIQRGCFKWRTAPEVSQYGKRLSSGSQEWQLLLQLFASSFESGVYDLCRKSELNRTQMRTWSNLYEKSGLSLRFYNHRVQSPAAREQRPTWTHRINVKYSQHDSLVIHSFIQVFIFSTVLLRSNKHKSQTKRVCTAEQRATWDGKCSWKQ